VSQPVRPPRAEDDALSERASPRRGAWPLLERLVEIEPRELAAVGWAWLFFFAVLTAYYVIRPIRDDMGVAGGVQNLPWLFTGTLTGMAAANPAFGFLASHLPRQRLVSFGYRFFAANLILFFVLFNLTSEAHAVWAGRVFFVWTAVFNLCAVSMFWSVMTDVFSTDQGKRLFGFIGAGGTIGAVTGSSLTSGLVGVIGPTNLLLVSAALLEIAAFAARRIFIQSRRASDGERSRAQEEPAFGGQAWDGLIRTAADPYLRGIAIHLVLFTVLTTVLYFQQATIVDAAIADRVGRTRFFANIDLIVNAVTLATQSFVTARLIRIFGLTTALAFLPVLSVLGFTTLSVAPTIAVLMTFQVIRRSSEFAIAKPSREVLFTTAARADRYKAKNFIDTFVYRAGDQTGAWFFALLMALGLSVSGTAAVAAAISVVGFAVAIWLGRRQQVEAAGNGLLPAQRDHTVTPRSATASE
jgi:ATP:ADP antiporter, AAA family